MKNISILFTVAAFLVGCASAGNKLALGTIGPVPGQNSIANSSATNGTLVVYSGYKVNADFNSRDPYRPEYSDYKIFAADGKFLQLVHNNSGTMLANVLPVALSAGRYFVVARANSYGIISVPVVIEAGRSTILHLETDSEWPDSSVFNQTNAVRLPDGRVVGWNAAQN